MDELVEAMATVLDEELDARLFTLRDHKTNHVNLVDGELGPGDTPGLAKDILDSLHERGWHFSRGTQCP